MPQKDFLFTTRAKDDLKDIWQYSQSTWGSEQADQYIDEILDAVDLIAGSPDVGRLRYEFKVEVQSFPVGRHVIFYRASEQVHVLAIVHQSMDDFDL